MEQEGGVGCKGLRTVAVKHVTTGVHRSDWFVKRLENVGAGWVMTSGSRQIIK